MLKKWATKMTVNLHLFDFSLYLQGVVRFVSWNHEKLKGMIELGNLDSKHNLKSALLVTVLALIKGYSNWNEKVGLL